ncbi:MAG: PIN domain-containing protein [Anaerolineales bacterium]|nr:PIN domain-containing protein [Anaerolineales bacterium]
MSLVLVDTDILIDFAGEVSDASEALMQLERESALVVSAVTEMGLLVGCRNKIELQNTDRLLERFQIVPLYERVSITAASLIRQYRLSHGLLLADALIAATALDLGCEFITKNQRDYRFVESLQLLSYPLK